MDAEWKSRLTASQITVIVLASTKEIAMNKRFKVIDNSLFTVFVGSRFECIAWVEEFAWNNEAHYRIVEA